MDTRIIERLKKEAEIFADAQRIRNMGTRRHKRMVKGTNGISISGDALEAIRCKNMLDYKIGGRAQVVSAIQQKFIQYTKDDLYAKFGNVPVGDPDPEILKQILEMKSRGL